MILAKENTLSIEKFNLAGVFTIDSYYNCVIIQVNTPYA